MALDNAHSLRSVPITSRTAYEQVRNAGWFKSRTQEAFKLILDNPNSTVDELWTKWGEKAPRNEFAKTVSSLVHDKRVVDVVGERKCFISGKLEQIHLYNGNFPRKKIPEPTKKELLEENTYLKQRNSQIKERLRKYHEQD